MEVLEDEVDELNKVTWFDSSSLVSRHTQPGFWLLDPQENKALGVQHIPGVLSQRAWHW